MIGWLLCRLGRHDWLAAQVTPTARLSRFLLRCARCGTPKRARNGSVVLYRTPGVTPEPTRAARRQAERRTHKDDAMVTKADRELADLGRLLG